MIRVAVPAIALSATILLAAEPTIAPRFLNARGETVALDAPGKVYLLDFWALGCKPCALEAPDLARLQHELGADGRFEVVAPVYGGWKPGELEQVSHDGGMDGVTVVTDPENWQRRLVIEGFPTKLLLRDGVVLDRVLGGGRETYERWKPRIERALAGAPISPRTSS